MTRLLKMSLSVVALLLVAMLVLTGCGKHKELEEGINNAQTSADEAKADAATNLAEAKKAVVDATASLEAAIATKADSATLAAEVSKLSTAIEAAKAIASTTDGALSALKVELESAIAAAKALVIAEADNLARELDAQIYKHVSETTVSKEALGQDLGAIDTELKAMLADLQSMKEDIVKITDGALTISSFTAINGEVIAERLLLDIRLDQLLATGLYDEDQVVMLLQAYKTADTLLLRAVSSADIATAKKGFEDAVYKTEIRHIVDDLYMSVYAAEANGFAGGAKDAAALYHLAASYVDGTFDAINDNYTAEQEQVIAELVRDYYETENDLLKKSLELYVAEVEAAVSELGDRYIVYPEALQEAGEGKVAISGAQDAEDLENARFYLNDLTAMVEAFNLNYVNSSVDVIEGVKATSVAAFEASEARAELLKGAKAAAEAAIALDMGYGDSEEAEAVALKQQIINDLNAWKKAVEDWNNTYMVDAGENATEANKQRAALLYALIAETEEKMTVDYGRLEVLIAEYKSTAYEAFEKYLGEFYKVPAANRAELSFSDLDLDKVTTDKYSVIALAEAGFIAWMDADNNPELTGIYEVGEQTVAESVEALYLIKDRYQALSAENIAYWAECNPNMITLTTADITMYDKTVPAALKWFEEKAVFNGDVIVWDTLAGGVKGYYLDVEGDDGDVVITKAYYDTLVDLNAKLDELQSAKKQAAIDIAAAIEALADGNDVKLSHKAAVLAAYNAKQAYFDQTLTQSRYDATLPELNEEFEYVIAQELIDEIDAAKARIDDLQTLLDTVDADLENLKSIVVGIQYPYFADGDEATYRNYKNALRDSIAAFLAEGKNDGDDVFNAAELAEANAKVQTARENIARNAIAVKLAAFAAGVEKLNTTYPYFSADEDKITEADYRALLNTLKDALPTETFTEENPAPAEYEGLHNSDVLGLAEGLGVHDIIRAADRLLSLDNVYDALAALEAKNTADENGRFADADARNAYYDLIQPVRDVIATELGNRFIVEADIESVRDALVVAENLVAKDIVSAAIDALNAVGPTEDGNRFVDEDARNAYVAKIGELESAIDAQEANITESDFVDGANSVVTAAKKIVSLDIVWEAYDALVALEPTEDGNRFTDATAREAYEAKIAPLATAIETELAKALYDEAEIQDAIDAVPAAKNIVSLDIVFAALDELNALAPTEDGNRFTDAAAREAYEAKIAPLATAIETELGKNTITEEEIADAIAAVPAAKNIVSLDIVFAALDELNALAPTEDGNRFTDAAAREAYEAKIAPLATAIETELGKNTITEEEIADAIAAVPAAKKLAAMDQINEYLEALGETYSVYPHFADTIEDNATAREAYSARIGALEEVIRVRVEDNADLAADDADLAVVLAAIVDAKALVETDKFDETEYNLRQTVLAKAEAMANSATVEDTYKYFADDDTKDTYKVAAGELSDAIDAYLAHMSEDGTAIADQMAALEIANTKIAKYEIFEGHFTVKYEAVKAAVEAADIDADKKETTARLVDICYNEYKAVVDTMAVEDLDNEIYKDNFVKTLNALLVAAGIPTIA